MSHTHQAVQLLLGFSRGVKMLFAPLGEKQLLQTVLISCSAASPPLIDSIVVNAVLHLEQRNREQVQITSPFMSTELIIKFTVDLYPATISMSMDPISVQKCINLCLDCSKTEPSQPFGVQNAKSFHSLNEVFLHLSPKWLTHYPETLVTRFLTQLKHFPCIQP